MLSPWSTDEKLIEQQLSLNTSKTKQGTRNHVSGWSTSLHYKNFVWTDFGWTSRRDCFVARKLVSVIHRNRIGWVSKFLSPKKLFLVSQEETKILSTMKFWMTQNLLQLLPRPWLEAQVTASVWRLGLTHFLCLVKPLRHRQHSSWRYVALI